MDILLNDQILDYKLETETTLGDVYSQINKWLNESGFIISSLKKDDEILDIEKLDNWSSKSINEINTLNIWVQLPGEQIVNKLNAIQQFYTIIIKAVEIKNIQLIKEISQNYNDIKFITLDLLEKVNLNFSSDDFHKVDLVFNETNILEGELPENEALDKFNLVLDNFIIILKSQIKEILDPVGELKSALKLIDLSIKEISNVSILLQTGKDKEAMSNILRFVEFSHKILRLVPFLKDRGIIDLKSLSFEGQTFEEFYKAFNLTLVELTEAFTVNDSVLIGDILEYEIVPKLQTLVELLNQIN